MESHEDLRKRPTPHPFSGTNAGYQSTLTAEHREVDFFKEIFDSALVDSIVLQTNNYQEYVGDNLFRCGEFSAINKWKNVSPGELYLFFATWLLVGIHGLNKMKDCWSTGDILHVPIFSKIMARDRFFVILKFLHFSPNEQQQKDDRMFKIRPVFDSLRIKFQQIFTPFQNLSIDESLLLFKGRLSFHQYSKTKRARFGIKFFKLCDSVTGYVYDLILYLGAKTETPDQYKIGKSGAVVITLMDPLFFKGYNVFVDNWYSSPTLAMAQMYVAQ